MTCYNCTRRKMLRKLRVYSRTQAVIAASRIEAGQWLDTSFA